MKNKHWLQLVPSVIGLGIGIVLTAIGSVMALNSALKLYVFEFDSPRYASFEGMCDTKWESNKEESRELSAEEKDECLEEKKAESKRNYTREQKEQLVNALALLLVGVPFWIFFARRKED